MRFSSLFFTTLLLSGTLAMAQESGETPKAEIGLNYSYTRVSPGAGFSAYNANGGFSDVAYNFNKHFAVVADLGATYVGTSNGLNFGNTSFEYLFGPRFNIRHGRFNPYIQTLFGGQRFSNGFDPGAADPRLGTSQNNFAMAFGGGLNIAVKDHIAVRPFQVDYFLTQIGPNTINYVQNDLRYSAGVVLRLGSK